METRRGLPLSIAASARPPVFVLLGRAGRVALRQARAEDGNQKRLPREIPRGTQLQRPSFTSNTLLQGHKEHAHTLESRAGHTWSNRRIICLESRSPVVAESLDGVEGRSE